jgi:hypothetical protein
MKEIYLIFGCLVGYFISLYIGGSIVKKTISRSWVLMDNDEDELKVRKKFVWATELVGHLERFIYTTSIIFGVKEFIAVWLVLKLSSQWTKWGGEKNPFNPQGNDTIYKSRATYQIFILGTGLSLVYGVLGGQITIWLSNCKFWYSFLSLVAVVGLNLYIYFRINNQINMNILKKEN